MEKKTKDMLISALISGGAIAVVSNVPYLNYVNVVCCLGVLAGGFVGTLYYKTKQKITPKEGALIGLFGGLFASGAYLIISVVSLLFNLQTVTTQFAVLQTLFKIPLNVATFTTLALVVSVLFITVIYSIFGTLGGLIGGAIFQKGK